MLRVLAITLVLLNIVLLGVQALRPAPPPAAVETPETADNDSGVASIYLLVELPGAPGGRDGTAECFSAGPFESNEQRDAALDFLAGAVLSIGSTPMGLGRWSLPGIASVGVTVTV